MCCLKGECERNDIKKGEVMERWFAVCCKPRQELVAQENLLRQGFHVYLPRIRLKRRRRGQWIDVIEVLFPRYIFIRIDPVKNSIAPVRSTRGVVGLVRFGGQPAIVANEIMDALVKREDSDSSLHQDSRPLFCVGEPVKLVEGPLAGMEGVFVQEDGEKRVIVLLEMLGKANKIRVNRDLVVQAA
jgi:transcriptional antiterminator RfaH